MYVQVVSSLYIFYWFWFLSQVTVTNGAYTSEASERKKVILQSTETQVAIAIDSMTPTSAIISWDAVPGVDGYMVSHNQPENKLLSGDVVENTTTNQMHGKYQSVGCVEEVFPGGWENCLGKSLRK